MKNILDICYSFEYKQFLDIHLPECDSFPVYVYFHGGALEYGDKSEEKVFFEYMTQHGIAVVSVNYRMYPNAKYPDYIEDAATAVAWVFRNISDYGQVSKIFVGGTSAGSYISEMLCFDDSWLGKYGIKSTDITAFVHDAGQPTCHMNVLRERGIDSRRVIIDDSAPLYYIEPNKCYPPMFITVSDNDIPNRYEQVMLLISTLKCFGYGDKVEFKLLNGKHCSYLNALDEQGVSVYGQIIFNYIKQFNN